MSRSLGKATARKPSPNPRYSSVGSKIDTGAVASREDANFARFRHDRRTDDFKRIKGASLAKLISESHPSESIYQLGKQHLSSRSSNYLLLDLRTPDEYERYHIRTAKSHPSSVLNRSVSQFTTEIVEHKNQSEKMIIIYDEDEKGALTAVDVFVRNGFENIYVLEGGKPWSGENESERENQNYISLCGILFG
eukprot:TRINITY_DN6244_c0_g1_i4.p1 TRINITY_DN6244_c0_g1~~TRINITY_DN6244_c0_g1_i4.p1  ORF type:complete len:193 (+),score=28.05 TRINITY_DN6244_c0_g1_i4:99-677(+)